MNPLINLEHVWDKPDEAAERRAKLPEEADANVESDG